MRIISLDNVKENMKLARNIFASDGRVLLAAGTILNGNYIHRLRELGLLAIYISDDSIGDIEVDELVKEQTRIQANKLINETTKYIRDGQSINTEKLSKVINDVIDEIINHRNLSFNLVEMRALNDFLFSHSLMVTVLSLMTGVAAGYSYARLKDLGIGCLLHDIGKFIIPDTILTKPGILTTEEMAEVQKHPQAGYEILKKCCTINTVSAFVVWQHHERYDGTGYPRGLKGKDIHEFARIAAIADVYDAMTNDRNYRKRLLPHEVIEYIRDVNKQQFDPEFAQLFVENVAPFPIGSMVLLNNLEKGVIIKVPKKFPTRPLVRVLYGQNGMPLDQPVDRELENDLTLFIKEVLKDET